MWSEIKENWLTIPGTEQRLDQKGGALVATGPRTCWSEIQHPAFTCELIWLWLVCTCSKYVIRLKLSIFLNPYFPPFWCSASWCESFLFNVYIWLSSSGWKLCFPSAWLSAATKAETRHAVGTHLCSEDNPRRVWTWTLCGIMLGINLPCLSEWYFSLNVLDGIGIFHMACWYEALWIRLGLYSSYLCKYKHG